MRWRWFFSGALSLVLLAAALGCGRGESGPKKFEVSGSVTFKKQPLDYGSIQFMPVDPNKGNFSGAEIKDGKYSIPRESGLVAGNYRVLISSGAKDAKAKEEPLPGESGPEAKERIPPEYNSASKKQVEVTAGKTNVFDFDIP